MILLPVRFAASTRVPKKIHYNQQHIKFTQIEGGGKNSASCAPNSHVLFFFYPFDVPFLQPHVSVYPRA